MKKLWVWQNGDYCVLEDGFIPEDTRGKFIAVVEDDIKVSDQSVKDIVDRCVWGMA